MRSISSFGQLFYLPLFVLVARARNILIAALIILILPATLLSSSESAKLALLVGSLTYVAALYYPNLAYQLTSLIWTAAFLLVIPLTLLAYEYKLQDRTWLFDSARDRIYIWKYTATKIGEHPLKGFGIRSSRKFANEDKLTGRNKRQVIYYPRPDWHPHNLFLQTWLDLGVGGVGLLIAIGLLLLRRIKHMAPRPRPCALATFTTAASVSAFGYDMWQSWLIAGYAWAIIFLLISIAQIDKMKMNERKIKPQG